MTYLVLFASVWAAFPVISFLYVIILWFGGALTYSGYQPSYLSFEFHLSGTHPLAIGWKGWKGIGLWGCFIVKTNGMMPEELRRYRHHEGRHSLWWSWTGGWGIIAYVLGMLIAFLQGKPPYRGNWFEKDARNNSLRKRW